MVSMVFDVHGLERTMRIPVGRYSNPNFDSIATAANILSIATSSSGGQFPFRSRAIALMRFVSSQQSVCC